MVKIAIAGGSGGMEIYMLIYTIKDLISLSEVASVVIGALIATKKHEITILSTRVILRLEISIFTIASLTSQHRRPHSKTTGTDWHGVQ
jgi:hypothetical protein